MLKVLARTAIFMENWDVLWHQDSYVNMQPLQKQGTVVSISL